MLRLAEKLFVCVMLFFMTGAFLPFIEGISTTAPSKYQILVQLPLYALTGGLTLLYRKTILASARGVKLLLALVLFALLSTAWSQLPLFTLRRSLILMGTTIFGIYFGTRFDAREQLRLLAAVCGLAVCASFLFGWFWPQYGIDVSVHNGSWRGIFAQKNSLGRFAVFSVMVFWFGQDGPGRWFASLGLVASSVLLLLSKSVTSAIVCALLFAMQFVFKLLRARLTFAVPVFAYFVTCTSGVALATSLTPVRLLSLVHRNPGMTGRTHLWVLSLSAIARKPWLGYGFKTFWLGMRGPSASIVQQLHWLAPTAHNGLLDLTLELGIIGLLLFVSGYLLLWRRALLFLGRDSGRIPVWLCSYLFFMLVYNFSERTILEQNTIFWVLYSAVAVNLYLDLPSRAPRTRPVEHHHFQPNLLAADPAEADLCLERL